MTCDIGDWLRALSSIVLAAKPLTPTLSARTKLVAFPENGAKDRTCALANATAISSFAYRFVQSMIRLASPSNSLLQKAPP